jgi:hypothetical protein
MKPGDLVPVRASKAAVVIERDRRVTNAVAFKACRVIPGAIVNARILKVHPCSGTNTSGR